MTTLESHLAPFDTWADVLAYAKTGKPLYYRAPLDRYAVRLAPEIGAYRFRVNKDSIRIFPPRQYADAFTADKGHLDRFSHPVGCLHDTNTPHSDQGLA